MIHRHQKRLSERLLQSRKALFIDLLYTAGSISFYGKNTLRKDDRHLLDADIINNDVRLGLKPYDQLPYAAYGTLDFHLHHTVADILHPSGKVKLTRKTRRYPPKAYVLHSSGKEYMPADHELYSILVAEKIRKDLFLYR